jgi:hypothetical protein
VPPPFPPHVAKDVKEARRLHDLVRDQGRTGFEGIVQGERALARLAHGHSGDETLEQIYDRPGAFHRPFIGGEQMVGGANEGMGSRDQADVTPGEPQTNKPEGGA